MRPALLLVLACAAACSAPPVETPLGDVVVRVEPADGRLQIRRSDGTVLLDGVAGGTQFRHADPEWHEEYGSFQVDEHAGDWQPVRGFSAVGRTADGGVRFDLDGGGHGSVERVGDGTLQISFTRDGLNRATTAFHCTPDERFLGFGAMPEDVEHRGSTVPIWVSEQGIGRVDTDEQTGDWFFRGTRHQSYFPVPFFLSSRNYAVRGDTSYRSSYAMCDGNDDWSVEAWEGTVSFHLFYASSPLEVLQLHAALDGAPPLPPAFTFAPWNDAVGGSAVVRQVAAELRADQIPSSVIWTEDWAGADTSAGMLRLTYNWAVDRTLYPDVEAVAGELHQSGFKWLGYFNTFAPTESDHFDPQYLIHTADGSPYVFDSVQLGKQSSLVDLSSPAGAGAMEQAMNAALDLGFDGWMADYGEWLPVDAVLASGESAEAAHDLYPVRWQELNARVLDERAGDGVERLAFVRSGFTGSQAIAHQVVWGGDQTTDFDHGDGLPSVLPIALGLGVAGLPFFGSDIAGYISTTGHPPVTEELFYRWATLGALSPIMRTHHGSNPADNWHFDSDAATLAHWKRWAVVHTRLYPYLMSSAAVASATGAPMMRQLALGYPDDPTAWTTKDQYLLGPSLLVAPVVTAGDTSRSVYFPGGHWVRLFGSPAAVDGPATAAVDVPVTELPVYAAAGAIIPLLPDGVETLVGAVPDARELQVILGADGALVEANGFAYTLSSSMPAPPTALTWNGAAVTATIDSAARTATVAVTGPGTLASSDATLSLTLAGGAADRPTTIVLYW